MAKRRLVVVGNGMSGARLIEDLLTRGGGRIFDITVFGDEPHGNYNRILLSGVLAGHHKPSDIVIHPPAWYAENGVVLRTGVRIDQIDLARKTVTAGGGIVEPYDALVLATGSRPLLPPIDGLSTGGGGLKGGVFVFRTIEDCEQIAEYARGARRAAVIGGGLLGIEAARGLLDHGLEVHIIHLAAYLMDAQLDPGASAVLSRQLQQMGLRIAAGTVTTAVLGNGHATGLAFRNGPDLDCDLVVVAAGIRPNVEMARQAGLRVGRGILVGDDLACAGAADVYAIGECAEHRGQVYGLVAPAWEQARVLADRLAGRDAHAVYAGSRMSTKLKVAGIDLAVMGVKEPIDDEDEVVSYAEPSRGIYKKLILHDNRLAGAIIIGDGGVVPSLGQMFAEATRLVDNRAELLFPFATDGPPPGPASLPDSAQICDCNAVSKAQIVEAVFGGARSLQAVCDITRASTGCGTCRPEVQRIIELACQGLSEPELLVPPPESSDPGPPPDQTPWNPAGEEGGVVTLTKIERLKREKDGLDILPDVPLIAGGGWQAIGDDDRERLKWVGVFFRRQTPGRFMMRVRITNGLANADQLRTIAGISEEFGTGSLDITTRQQLQVRGFEIGHLPEIWARLERAGLASLQTGMDNIRTVVGCALAGLAPRELFDASPVVHEFTQMFLRNKAFTNLPRKLNVSITGCLEHCTHAESQDLALTPAVKEVDGRKIEGFNVAVGGKMGSGGFRLASPLDIFVEPERAAALCAEIVLLFRDYGSRAARNKARLAFLVESWGVARLRAEVQNRMGRSLLSSGRDARVPQGADHLGVGRQKQNGLSYVGLAVPVGRISAPQLREIARVASVHGNGDVRLTTGQNVIIPNVADHRMPDLVSEPLLRELPHDPPGAIRGLVACTGIDYCHFALIETKEVALRTARYLADRLPHGHRLSMHWSGCPAGCGNHVTADVGLLGKNIRIGDEMVEAVDVFVGGRAGPHAKAGTKVLEDVPCDELPRVLEQVIPYISSKHKRRQTPVPAAAVFSRAHV